MDVINTLLLFAAVHSTATSDPLPASVHFIGDGYNILSANPDGAQWLSGGEDPGLLLSRHIFNIVSDSDVMSEITYEHHDSCQESHLTELVFSPKSYQDKLMQHVTFSGSQIQTLRDSAFTLSSGYSSVKTETQGQHKVIQDISSTCTHGTARYLMSLVESKAFLLSEEFTADVCALPEKLDAAAYNTFIDTWGTHVVTELKLGYRLTNRSTADVRDYVSMVLQKVPHDVSIGGALLGSASSYVVDLNSFKVRHEYADPIATSFDILKTGSASSLEPIGITLTSIDVAFTSKFWGNLEFSNGLCPANISRTLETRRQNLLQALGNYAVLKGAEVPTGSPLAIPVVWPSGTYGLPKSKAGCPVNSGRWLEGWLNQNMETQTPDSSWTPNHLDANLTTTHLLLRFCTKSDVVHQFSMDWPSGDYCIFKFKSCPTGFVEGFVQWDDENTNNANTHGGTLPDGSYGADTLMKYCCRSDGDTYNPITLPVDKPFYLFQYQNGCQSVRGMTTSVEHLLWDDDDTHATTSAAIGAVHPGMRFCNPPKYPGCGTGSTIYYCYYQKSDGISTIIG